MNVAPEDVTGDYNTVPASGHVNVTITRLANADTLLATLQRKGLVTLMARTGPNEHASAQVHYYDHDS